MSVETSLKLIVVGPSGTGKTALLHRFVHHTFSEKSRATVGVDFYSKVIPHPQAQGQPGDPSRLKLQIWDTAGQEAYRAVTQNYYRGALGCLLVYDITRVSTFEKLDQWLEDVRVLVGPDVNVILAGNKCDLEQDREVTAVAASQYAQEKGLLFFETSAKSAQFVEEAFVKLAVLSFRTWRRQRDASAGRGGVSASGSRRRCCV
eukprot:TRINITY_DN1952_c1_g1_i1.p2 TRINITY_DN1952_c1_g1~~TRINITY_DN1952_c1_g1_i1.p2  ORF type:complete len:204 (+),score=83.13 TRINITY_DN1952_c1_g1_i1:65-676(+)